MGWNYTDGFVLAYSDTTGAMTRYSPCSANTHFISTLNTADGYVKVVGKSDGDTLSMDTSGGLLCVLVGVDTTYDGIDLYDKTVADKSDTDIKLSDLEARILALENS